MLSQSVSCASCNTRNNKANHARNEPEIEVAKKLPAPPGCKRELTTPDLQIYASRTIFVRKIAWDMRRSRENSFVVTEGATREYRRQHMQAISPGNNTLLPELFL